MPSIPQIKIGNTTYDLKDKRVDNIKTTLTVTGKDICIAGGQMASMWSSRISNPQTPPPQLVLLYDNDTYWCHSPFIRVYPGMTMVVNHAFHAVYFADATFMTPVAATIHSGTVTVPANAKYLVAFIAVPIATPLPDNETIFTISEYVPKYSDNDIFVLPEISDWEDTIGATITKKYTSGGFKAAASDTLYRGAVFPYEGSVLCVSGGITASTMVPFAYARNGNYIAHVGCLLCQINPGQSNGVISIQHYNYFKNISFSFQHEFQGNLNGLQITIQDDILTAKYVYEGQIVTNTANLTEAPVVQILYDLMEHDTGCIIQTNVGDNITYYGKGFADYDDYYRFVKNLNNDTQIADHSIRIEALEESGGGGGGGGTPAELNWEKGMDLLEFGQEYLYAWLNALNTGSEYKVLFTGDSTTAYYSGTENGIKEIFQSCMVRAGYSYGTYVNRAVSGINATTWVSSYLAQDISEAPTLYVIRHGFNNDAGETEEEIAATYRAKMIEALESIRSSLPVTQCSIVLMMPNTSDDDANHRGTSMKKKLDPILRQLARTYGCAFIDTFRTWYDPGVYADPMYDNPFGDGRSIHPNGLMNRVIVSKLFDFVCPSAYRRNV